MPFLSSSSPWGVSGKWSLASFGHWAGNCARRSSMDASGPSRGGDGAGAGGFALGAALLRPPTMDMRLRIDGRWFPDDMAARAGGEPGALAAAHARGAGAGGRPEPLRGRPDDAARGGTKTTRELGGHRLPR